MLFDLTSDEMAACANDEEAERELEASILVMRARYSAIKRAKVGVEMACPVCGKMMVKRSYQHAFCSNIGAGNCKDRFWNLTVTSRRERARAVVNGEDVI